MRMGKKGKDGEAQAPNPNGVTNRDIIQRMNFLYQASVYMNALVGPSTCPSPVDTDHASGRDSKVAKRSGVEDKEQKDTGMVKVKGKGGRTYEKGKKQSKNVRLIKRPWMARTTGDLAKTYVSFMKVVGQRTTVKMLVL